jgi:dsRNA-specific ribonuclease
MAVVMRGWSRTASTALKLATAERIIGYQFKDIDKLYEALDQTERTISLPSGKKAQLRPRNSRLALVGDALGKLYVSSLQTQP